MQLSADEIPNIDTSVIDAILNAIFKGAVVNSKALLQQTLNVFETAIKKGFGKTLSDIAFDTPDFELLSNLTYNVGVFSAFKNHSQIKATTNLLIGEDGRIRPFKSFKNEALKLDGKYNKQWLKTEYDQAVTSARSARRWNDIQRTKEVYPNLRYVAIKDDRTRQLHNNWHNMILPIDHPFWQTHYPPNDYGCRCTARRTDDAVNDQGVDVDNMPKLPPQFNTNVGSEGKVFNNDHPYFKTPNFKEVAKFAQKGLFSQQRKEVKAYIAKENITKSLLKTQIGNVKVSGGGIREILNKPSHNVYLRNNLLFDLKSVLQKAIYVKSANDDKNNPMVKQYHYLLLKVNESNFYLNIREHHNGELFLYAITDQLK